MLPPYLDRLDPARQDVFKKLVRFADEFILAGGTAIMLQLGHRLSYDFDCFTQKKIRRQILLEKAKRVFGRFTTRELQSEEMLFIHTPDGIEINFVWHPYPTLNKPVSTDSISLFHLDDLVTNKTLTLGRRNTWRDYVDLFFLIKWNIYSLEEIIHLSEKRFGGEFNSKLFLGQLTFFDDIKIVDTTFLKESYTPEEIKSFLQKQVDSYLKTILPTG